MRNNDGLMGKCAYSSSMGTGATGCDSAVGSAGSEGTARVTRYGSICSCVKILKSVSLPTTARAQFCNRKNVRNSFLRCSSVLH